jgi:LCP family protein required for cell wall assembly
MSPIKARQLLLPLTIFVLLIIPGIIYYFLIPHPYRKTESTLKPGPEGVINILIIGKDARALNPAQDRGGTTRIPREKTAHSDIIVICHINLNQNRLNLVAVPRDLLVIVPNVTSAPSLTDFNAMEKITHTYAIGGEPLLRRTLEHLLGIKIDRFIAFDFDSFRMTFRLLRSILGAISLGTIKLADPDQALKFVRQRNGLTYDDLDRCRNTLNFIKTIAIRLWRIADTRIADLLLKRLFAIIGTDTDLTLNETKELISRLRHQKFTPNHIQTAVLVSEGKPVTLNRYAMTLSCYLPIYPEMEKQIARFLHDRDTVSALDFMTQQHYFWPDYMTKNYDLLPDHRTDTLIRQEIVKRILELQYPAGESN